MNRQQLIEDNMNLVYFLVNKYYPTFNMDEDIIQCGMEGLCKAANTWEEGKSEFSTYASKCVLHEIYKEFQRRCRHKDVMSLGYPIATSDKDCATTAGDLIVGEEDVDYVDYESFYEQLKPKEKLIVDYRRMGLTNEEIANKLGCHENSVSRKVRELRYLWRFINGN